MKNDFNGRLNAMTYKALGWNEFFQKQFDKLSGENYLPARITGVRKNAFVFNDGKKEGLATLAGTLFHGMKNEELFPVTGDWVLLNETVIAKVLTRKNALSRGASGTKGSKSDLL